MAMTGATFGGVLPVHTSKSTKRACVKAALPQSLEAFNRIDGRGQFDAFAGDFACDIGRRDIDRHQDIALDDVVQRHGPFRFAIPKYLLGSGFVGL